MNPGILDVRFTEYIRDYHVFRRSGSCSQRRYASVSGSLSGRPQHLFCVTTQDACPVKRPLSDIGATAVPVLVKPRMKDPPWIMFNSDASDMAPPICILPSDRNPSLPYSNILGQCIAHPRNHLLDGVILVLHVVYQPHLVFLQILIV